MLTLPHNHGHKPPEVTAAWVQDQVAIYSSQDDVFNEQFLATVIFNSNSRNCNKDSNDCSQNGNNGTNYEVDVEFEDEADVYLQERGTQQVVCTSVPQLLPGPYALVGSQLRDVWKLIDDINGTCMVTLNPQQK